MSRKKTHEEYVRELKRLNTGTFVIGTYKGAHTAIKHGHSGCNHTWMMKPNTSLSMRCKCPICAHEARITSRRLPVKEYKRRLRDIKSPMMLTGEYKGVGHKTLHLCADCKTSQEVIPLNLLQGSGCRVCDIKSRVDRHYTKTVVIKGKTFQLQGYEDRAIKVLLKKYRLGDIRTNVDRKLPTVKYSLGGKEFRYYPDIGIRGTNILIEVKSPYTLLKDDDLLRRNKAKAAACVQQGFDYRLMLFGGPNTEILPIPKNWYTLPVRSVRKVVRLAEQSVA